MKTQLKRNTLGTRVPSLPAVSVRNATIPNQYVDPERLQAALQTLTTARSFLLNACDQADSAARRAGTPLRTHTVRSKIDCLTDEVRGIESQIASAAAGEVEVCKGLAAGVGRTLSTRRTNEIDREFDPTDRSGTIDARYRVNRDLEWEFLHRSLRDPRWYRVARATNQTGSIDPSLVAQFAQRGDLKKPKSSGPMGRPLPSSIEAVKKLRALLKDGGWGEDRLTNGELKELVKIFSGLSTASATAVVAELTDAELKLIADDMDSSGIGNYDGLFSSEKEVFVADMAKKLDAKQFARIAVAFDDPEQIAKILAKTKDSWPAKQGFLCYCQERLIGRSVEQRRSAPGASITRSAATLLANLNQGELASFLCLDSISKPFLEAVFRAAAGPKEGTVSAIGPDGSSYSTTHYWFDPTLLLKINGVALTLPASSEKQRFAVFQLTTETLAWAKKESTLTRDDADLKQVLIAATNLIEPKLLTHLQVHSDKQNVYEEWMVQLLNSGETTLAQSLVTKAGTPREGGDLWWTGYLLGIVQRAANRIDRDREARAQFAVAVIGALLNALPVTVMVPAALLLEIVDESRGDALKGENLGDLLLHGVKASLTGEVHRADRDLLGNGFADALGSRVQTR